MAAHDEADDERAARHLAAEHTSTVTVSSTYGLKPSVSDSLNMSVATTPVAPFVPTGAVKLGVAAVGPVMVTGGPLSCTQA
jgi:hypothetical protein